MTNLTPTDMTILISTALFLLILVLPINFVVTLRIEDNIRIRAYLFGFLLVLRKKMEISDLLDMKKPDISLLPIFKTVRLIKLEVTQTVNLYDYKSVLISQFFNVFTQLYGKITHIRFSHRAIYDKEKSLFIYLRANFIPVITLQKIIERGIKNARATNSRNSQLSGK